MIVVTPENLVLEELDGSFLERSNCRRNGSGRYDVYGPFTVYKVPSQMLLEVVRQSGEDKFDGVYVVICNAY